jgi:formylmethanofuran dehydrogenase subunit E
MALPRQSIEPLECGLCGEPCFADDWCEAVGEFVCAACVETEIEAHQLEAQL